MPSKPTTQPQLLEENLDLRARLEKAKESLSEILSGEADALFVSGVGGAQLFTLKGADQSYRTLIENMSEGALTLTLDGLVLYANRRFAEMLGTPLEKVIGSGIHTWFAPESRQVLQTLLRKDAVDNRHVELALAAADGTQVPVYLSVSRLLLEETPDALCMVVTDLTEQKRNEAILAAEKLSNAILEQSADAIVICDGTGRIIRASKQAHALYDRNLLGQPFEHAFPLHQLDGYAFPSVGAIDTSHRQSIEARLEHGGQGFDFLVSVGHLNGARNELLGSVVTLTDITERKRAKDKLQESKNLLQLVVENVPLRIFWKDRNFRYLGCNTQFAKDAGRASPNELTGKTDFEIESKGQAELYRADDKEVLDSGAPKLDIEAPQTTPDGNTIWLHTSKVPLRDKDNQIIGILGLYQDITKRRQAGLELRESERRFSDMLKYVELISMMIDREGRITYCNEYLLRLTGWQYEEVIGRNWFEVFVPPELSNLKEEFLPTLLANLEEARHHENEILTRSGERRLIRWNNSVLRSGAGEVIGIASIGEDITERRAAESRIAYLNRVYAMLSGINTLIVRTVDRDDLFRKSCRIAVDAGNFRMAMICIVDRSTTRIVPVASAGKDKELLTRIKNLLSSSEEMSNTMIARAISEKRAVISNDSQNDPQVIFAGQYIDHEVHSMVVLPLIVAGEAVGALSLYTHELDFFQDDEMKLLTELAGDIAFAIDHIGKQERLDYLAYYDVLTGLANRRLFLERVGQYMSSAASGGYKLALLLIDLERFRNINDSLGRPAGDELLRQVAEWLQHNIGGKNLLARVGADHFAMVVPEIKHEGELSKLFDKKSQAFLEHPFRLNDAVFRIAAKAGVALFPNDGVDAETLFKHAEAALKNAKESGDRYLFYTQKMSEAVAGKLTLENQLRQAIDNEEFVLHYQPKVNLASGKVTSAEALIRWNDPRTGLVPPGKFIPILEETGLIHEVGRWALHHASADYLRWRAAGLPAVRIAVNVSSLQLHNPGFIAEIEQAIAIDTHVADGLELEITESLIMDDIVRNITTLHAIRAMGITIAIDDFGTGFSSLNYLAKLPVDTLKIDRSFVIEMTSAEGLALVSTIIIVAHALKLKVVAEGVETEEQASQLRLLNCDEMQGFLFSRPVPAEVFETKFLAPLPAADV